MRRHAPEDHDTLPPLFAHAEKVAAARDRGELGARRAASRAGRLDDAWRSEALARVRAMAESRTHFMAEDCGLSVPPGADPRAAGAILQDAKRAGWIVADGFAPANSSNRGGKVRWRSLIHVPAGEPASP